MVSNPKGNDPFQFKMKKSQAKRTVPCCTLRKHIFSQRMSLASPRSMPRSPGSSNPKVLRLEMKLNREESINLEKANTTLRTQAGQLRDTLKQIKGERRAEMKLRRKLIADEEIKNEEKLKQCREEFANAQANLQATRKQMANEKLSGAANHVTEVKSMCQTLKSSVENSVAEMQKQVSLSKEQFNEIALKEPENEASRYKQIENNFKEAYDMIPDAGLFTEFPSRPKVCLSEVMAFECPGTDAEAEPVQHFDSSVIMRFTPSHLVHTMKWIKQCIH